MVLCASWIALAQSQIGRVCFSWIGRVSRWVPKGWSKGHRCYLGEILLLRIIANLWIPIYGLLNNDFLIIKKLPSLSLLFVWELWLPCIADILMIATIGFHKIAPKCFQLVFRPRTFLDVKQRGLLEWTGQVDMWACRCWHEDFRHPAPSFSEASVASPSESTLRWKSENAWYAAGSSLGCLAFSGKGAGYANSHAGMLDLEKRIDSSALPGSGKDSRDPIKREGAACNSWGRSDTEIATRGAIRHPLSLKCLGP